MLLTLLYQVNDSVHRLILCGIETFHHVLACCALTWSYYTVLNYNMFRYPTISCGFNNLGTVVLHVPILVNMSGKGVNHVNAFSWGTSVAQAV